MSPEPKQAPDGDQVAHIRALLEAERAEFKARRDAYTEDLIAWEMRVCQREAQLADAIGRLSAGQTLGNLPPMPNSELIPRPHGWGRPLSDPDDPLARVGNLKEWCRRNGVGYSSLKRWKTEAGGNPIPMKWASYFRKEYGVPFTYWPHGVANK